MPLSETEKKNILATVTIELERMFTVVSNLQAPESDHAKFLAEVETEMKAALAERHLLVTLDDLAVPSL